jgi:hypothetical protein
MNPGKIIWPKMAHPAGLAARRRPGVKESEIFLGEDGEMRLLLGWSARAMLASALRAGVSQFGKPEMAI